MSEKRNALIQFRCTQYEKNRIKGLAKLYAGGDMSLWLRYAALEVERKHLIYVTYAIKNPAKDRSRAGSRKSKA